MRCASADAIDVREWLERKGAFKWAEYVGRTGFDWMLYLSAVQCGSESFYAQKFASERTDWRCGAKIDRSFLKDFGNGA